MAVGAVPAFEETEPIMEERVEPAEEAAPFFQNILVLETSAADKGKGKEVFALTKKKKPIPSIRSRGVVIGSSAAPASPAHVLEEGV